MRTTKMVLVFVALCMTAVVGAWGSGAASLGAEQEETPETERTGDEAVGASIAHPKDLVVDRERFTYDETYGYTLWRPAEPGAEGSADGGTPEARVALAYGLKPDEIEARVRERLSSYPGVSTKRETVRVGEKGLEGVAIGPIPGSTPSTEVYVADGGRVYQINVYFEGPDHVGLLDPEDKELLSSLRFERPSRSVASLGLKDGKKAESHHGKGNSEPSKKEREARIKAAKQAPEGPASSGPTFVSMSYSSLAASVPVYGEYQIGEGCWRATSTFYFQTQHGYGSNRSAYDGINTGFTKVGRPNYWGEYTHGSLGYGRCASTYYVNDMYAIDYPLNRGDYVFSPFSGGTVTFAGRNYSHANYGVFVVIRASNGKYVSISGHLNSLAYGIRPGAVVNADTVIGYAGNTGDPSIPVGEVHLHQGFYRYPGFKPDGSPYGGRGLQAVYHRYVGTAAGTGPGTYQFAWPASDTSSTRTKGESVSN